MSTTGNAGVAPVTLWCAEVRIGYVPLRPDDTRHEKLTVLSATTHRSDDPP